MEYTEKSKKKKVPIEISALRRDLHKYYTLYNKQKEFSEEKLQALSQLEEKYGELEKQFQSKEKELERLYSEKEKQTRVIELKDKELEKKTWELEALVANYQELSKILHLLDKHMQFLESEKLVDIQHTSYKLNSSNVNAEHLSELIIKDALDIVQPKDCSNKNNCKIKTSIRFSETELDSLSLDTTIRTAEEILANREINHNQGMLISLQTEKERLSRLLNHPEFQKGSEKKTDGSSQVLNVDNNNANRTASGVMKSSTLLKLSEEKTSAKGSGSATVVENLREKLQICQMYLKKEKELNKATKNEMIKLIDKLQEDLKSSQLNLEIVKSQEKSTKAKIKELEKERRELQKDLKASVMKIESSGQAIKTLGLQCDRDSEQIKLLTEKNKLLEEMSRIGNRVYQDNIRDIMESTRRDITKVKVSKAAQTGDKTESEIKLECAVFTKFELVLKIQELLEKYTAKTDEVLQLERIMKKKSLILDQLKGMVVQQTALEKCEEKRSEKKMQDAACYKQNVEQIKKSPPKLRKVKKVTNEPAVIQPQEKINQAANVPHPTTETLDDPSHVSNFPHKYGKSDIPKKDPAPKHVKDPIHLTYSSYHESTDSKKHSQKPVSQSSRYSLKELNQELPPQPTHKSKFLQMEEASMLHMFHKDQIRSDKKLRDQVNETMLNGTGCQMAQAKGNNYCSKNVEQDTLKFSNNSMELMEKKSSQVSTDKLWDKVGVFVIVPNSRKRSSSRKNTQNEKSKKTHSPPEFK